MPNPETPAERYRRLAEQCLEAADNFPHGEHRDALIQMAQVWQRLADQYAGTTTSLFPPTADKQPTVQQQQRVQAKDEDKDKC